MAFVDSDLEFADALDLSSGTNGTAAAHDCTNYVDLQAADRLAGRVVYLNIVFTTAMDSAEEDATITFDLEADADTTFSSGAVNIWSSQTLTEAGDVCQGTDVIQVPISVPSGLRYLNLEYTIGTEAATAGIFDAYITLDAQSANVTA